MSTVAESLAFLRAVDTTQANTFRVEGGSQDFNGVAVEDRTG